MRKIGLALALLLTAGAIGASVTAPLPVPALFRLHRAALSIPAISLPLPPAERSGLDAMIRAEALVASQA